MRSIKHRVVAAGFRAFGATGLHRLLAAAAGGLGAILTLHHVRPFAAPSTGARGEGAFAPNRLLEVEPSFLDASLGHIRDLGFDLVSLDEAAARIAGRRVGPRFVALTFDDGYRDLADHALPILRRHGAPFAAFVTTGFAERTARLWWVELEEALRRLDRVAIRLGGRMVDLPCATVPDKEAAFMRIYAALRAGNDETLFATIGTLADRAGLDRVALVEERCLDWTGVRALAAEPLCTLGAHTLTHPRLAKHDEETVRREMAEGRNRLQAQTGRTVRHFAYPVGDPTSAGPRDFALARDLGFATAVTTRPGMLFRQHVDRLQALPRVSLNGLWQDLGTLEIMLSGAPFAVWNKGRRVVA